MNWDPLGKLVIEMRADAAVAALVGTRVSGFQAKPAWVQGPGGYLAHVVLVNLGGPRYGRVPAHRPRIVAMCRGRTPEEAGQLATVVSDALHWLGGRVHTGGLGIYISKSDALGEAALDPDTKQPTVPVFFDLIASTQAVA